MKKDELARLQAYLRKTFGAATLEVRPQPKKDDMAEVFINNEFVAALYRGVGDTRTPLLVALVGYIVVAGGAQLALGFGMGMGAPGIWWGLVIGFGTIACVATIGIYNRFKLPTPTPREIEVRQGILGDGLLGVDEPPVADSLTR